MATISRRQWRSGLDTDSLVDAKPVPVAPAAPDNLRGLRRRPRRSFGRSACARPLLLALAIGARRGVALMS